MTRKAKETYAVVTGPIVGPVTLADGTEVDVTPPVVEVSSQEEADAVAHAIGVHYTEHGHPTDKDFTYIPPEG